jgi:PhnB protein
MQVNPYLSFDGRCEEAFTFYAALLGGEIQVRIAYEGSPMADHVPPELRGKLMHARISIAGQVLMGSDSIGGMKYEPPRGMTINLSVSDPAEADRIFAAFAEGGAVGMPIQETFWALRFGVVTDRFNIPWMINCEKAP